MYEEPKEDPYAFDDYQNLIKQDANGGSNSIMGEEFGHEGSFPKMNKEGKNLIKEDIFEIKQELPPKEIQGMDDFKIIEPTPEQKIKVEMEEEKNTRVMEKADLIDSYSFVSRFNGEVLCFICNQHIPAEWVKVLCVECSQSSYFEVPIEDYEKTISGNRRGYQNITSERDEFKSVGTKMKFSNNSRPKAARRGRTPNKAKEPYIYCLKCLRSGNEAFDHLKTHSYTILNKLDQKLFTDTFTLGEEAALIHGIQKWGVDNWSTLSSHLKNSKDYRELWNHFYTYYYDIFAHSGNSEDPLKTLKDRSLRALATPKLSMPSSLILSKLPHGKSLFLISSSFWGGV